MRDKCSLLCASLVMAVLLCLSQAGQAQVACAAVSNGIVWRTVLSGSRVELDGYKPSGARIQLEEYANNGGPWQWFRWNTSSHSKNAINPVMEFAPQASGLEFLGLESSADVCFNYWEELQVMQVGRMAGGALVMPYSAGAVIAAGASDFPSDLWNISALAVARDGGSQRLAVRNDGTVVDWGSFVVSTSTPLVAKPAGLSDVLDAKVGGAFSMVLRNDGTVVAWGGNDLGQASPPAGLRNVVAIAAGTSMALVLRADGTVVGWGHSSGQPPAGLTNVVDIAAGSFHGLALKADGTVVSWGSNDHGQRNGPAGVANVVAIDAVSTHSTALTADGTAIAWGCDVYVGGICDPAQRVLGTGVQAVHARAGKDLLVLPNNVYRAAGQGVTIGPGTWIEDILSGDPLTTLAVGGAVTLATPLRSGIDVNYPIRFTGATQWDQQSTTASGPRLLRISNIGSEMLRIGNLRADARFQIQGGNCFDGRRLPAGGHCTLMLAYTLASAVAGDGSLTVDISSANGTALGNRRIALLGETINRNTVALQPGWNLLGNASAAQLSVQTLFGEPAQPIAGVTERIVSVWQWSNTPGRWKFYSPKLSAADNAAYATAHDLLVLDAIAPREGYWVQTNAVLTFPMPAGPSLAFDSAAFAGLPSGWHQLADAGRRHPRDFNAGMSATPPQPGATPAVPQNFQSLWAWDAVQSRWYFYAPSLDAQGGSAMADYIAGRGMLDFSAAGRVLDPASGFWVLKP